MVSSQQFYGLDLAWLKRHRAALQSALDAVALGQSYQIGDKSVTRANYSELAASLASVQIEITRQESALVGGQQPSGSVVYPDFTFLSQ